MLHNDQALFEQVVLRTSEAFGIQAGIVEKDYFVTLLLKKIIEHQPDIIFKGGTSLSKCHKLIHRFSEDIDLNIDGENKPSESARRNLSRNIMKAVDELGFSVANPEEIKSRRDFNKYEVTYPALFKEGYLKPNLIVETAVFFRAYPHKEMQATSYVYEYLQQNGFENVIQQYHLEPFMVKVQTAERTFVDKVFALCDYYLSGKTAEHSRHIYDIHQLLTVVELNDELKAMAAVVRVERKSNKTCLSALDEIDVSAVLEEIISKDAYKSDYETVTMDLLFQSVSYTEALESLIKVKNSGVF